MQLMMKMTLIKFGLVCLISTVVLSACIKKEQPEQEQSNNDTEVQNNEQAETTLQEQPQPQYTTLEEIQPEPAAEDSANHDDQQILVYNENGQADVKTATTSTPTQPNVESKPASSVPSTPATNNTSSPAPAKTATTNNSEDTASEDDAIAAAIKAAQPALQ
ncbi:hypothetical protein GCM10023206_16900 [Acinetobacter puyangensis]|uniref:Internalin n=2 Tax=Acinetobacter puyangensis TaxID=1096779 RepID=A0A240E5M4_9GAMM|nr:hypothetical protein SAMN05421731_102205 [Acinetobacter puyangensis]